MVRTLHFFSCYRHWISLMRPWPSSVSLKLNETQPRLFWRKASWICLRISFWKWPAGKRWPSTNLIYFRLWKSKFLFCHYNPFLAAWTEQRVLNCRWKLFQEGRTTGCSISCRRKEGGIFQHIRFALFALEQLADKCILVSFLVTMRWRRNTF